MRCGDLSRMQGMLKNGKTLDEVKHAFRTKYTPEVIEEFLKESKPKKRRRRKPTTEETDGQPDLDMQSGASA